LSEDFVTAGHKFNSMHNTPRSAIKAHTSLFRPRSAAAIQDMLTPTLV
jgi:hypothetical protein